MLYPNYIAFLWGGGGPKTGVVHENVLRIFQKLRFLSLTAWVYVLLFLVLLRLLKFVAHAIFTNPIWDASVVNKNLK